MAGTAKNGKIVKDTYVDCLRLMQVIMAQSFYTTESMNHREAPLPKKLSYAHAQSIILTCKINNVFNNLICTQYLIKKYDTHTNELISNYL